MHQVQFTDQNRYANRRGGRVSSVHEAHEEELGELFQSNFKEESGHKMEGKLLKCEINRGWDPFNTGWKFLNPGGPTEEWVERHVMLSLDAIEFLSYEDEEDVHHMYFTDIDRVHHRDSASAGMDKALKPGSFRNKLLMHQALSASSTDLYGDVAKRVELGPFDFMILTCNEGFHRGQPVVFRAASQVDRDIWVAGITQILLMRRSYELFPEPVSELQRVRRIVRRYYMNHRSQLLVAFLIVFNFFANIVDHQNNSPDHEVGAGVFKQLDLAFTCIFVIELSVNMFATLVWEFLSDGWNYFDALVVIISVTSLAAENIPGGATLKLTRTFRVFRLFKRIKSMRRIMASLIRALPSMANAYVLLTLLTAIYAILCVNFFRDMNEERFGTFFSSMFTLWQIMTGDDWSVLVRDLLRGAGSAVGVALFFVSFQLLVTFTMVNVVICVLLEGFSSAAPAENTVSKSFHGSKSVEEWHAHCMLFPLTRQLIRCRDGEHLQATVRHVFSMVAQTLAGGARVGPDGEELALEQLRLSFDEVRGGLMQVRVHPPPMLQRGEWDAHVAGAGLCDADGAIDLRGFEQVMTVALKQYQIHGADKAVETSDLADPRRVIRTLTALKGRMLVVDEQKRREERLALARARWGQGYESGGAAKGGWGPGESTVASDEARGPAEEGSGRLELVQKMVREMKGMELHMTSLQELARQKRLSTTKEDEGEGGQHHKARANGKGKTIGDVLDDEPGSTNGLAFF